MTRRPWLRHPPRTIRPPARCPTGLPRFTSLAHARDALLHGYGRHTLTAIACHLCGGAHLTEGHR